MTPLSACEILTRVGAGELAGPDLNWQRPD